MILIHVIARILGVFQGLRSKSIGEVEATVAQTAPAFLDPCVLYQCWIYTTDTTYGGSCVCYFCVLSGWFLQFGTSYLSFWGTDCFFVAARTCNCFSFSQRNGRKKWLYFDLGILCPAVRPAYLLGGAVAGVEKWS